MQKLQQIAVSLLMGLVVIDNPMPIRAEGKKQSPAKASREQPGEKVLWIDPADIRTRDLLHGQGGVEHQPAATGFQFTKEDSEATNPKFSVHDQAGGKWKIKLGDEARPETVATRLVWAAGFHTDEDYFLPEVHVDGMPEHVKRGKQFITADGTMKGARLERDIPGEKKLGPWKWSDGSFSGTREWNGLRVMMSLINNWDLKDVNNTIYEVGKKDQKQYIYVVTDLGASFGPSHLDLGRKTDKGDLGKFSRAEFIRKTHPETVDFAAPGAPSPIFIFNPVEYFRRRHLQWIGRGIPREDARWMGSVLARLSPQQIRDAFRAGGYSPEEVEAFASIIEKRISSLSEL